MDVSAARAVETITCDAKKSGKTVYICGMKPKVAKILRGLEADCCMLPKFKFEKRIDAVRAAVKEVTDAAKIQARSARQFLPYFSSPAVIY